MGTPSIPGFEDLQEIGRGGFGVVYRAFQPDLDRPVAIKVLHADLDAQSKRRFQREAVAMGRLSGHPYILPIYSVGFAETGEPFLVLPFLSGGSLGDRLTGGPVAEPLAASLGVKMAAALDFAHQRELVHRDVKPDNILFNDFDEPVLADFGIAAVAGMDATATGVVTASVLHAPPEVLDAHRPTPLSDQYSLASTLYEAVAGRAAFHSPDDASLAPLLVRIMTTPPPDLRPSGVSGELCDILERAMAKEPAERFPAMTDFASALGNLTGVAQGPSPDAAPRTDVTLVGVPAPPDAASTEPSETATAPVTRRGRGKVVAIVGILVTLAIVGIAIAARETPPGQRVAEPESPESDASGSEHIFVYGTTMPGHSRYELIEEFVADATPARVTGRLYDTAAGYPAARFGGGRTFIDGYLLRLRPDGEAAARRTFTQIEAGLFEPVEVETTDGVLATAYEWIGSTEGMEELDGRWTGE